MATDSATLSTATVAIAALQDQVAVITTARVACTQAANATRASPATPEVRLSSQRCIGFREDAVLEAVAGRGARAVSGYTACRQPSL
jgi:hypothetical protein